MASITQTANPAGVSSSSNVATYSGVALGAAAPNRIIVVTVASELTSASINSVTLGGSAMTAGTQGNQGVVYARTFYLAYPTGTTADVVVTYGANPDSTQNHIAVYRVLDAVYTSTGADQSTDMDTTDPLTTGSITVASGGLLIAVAGCATDGTAKTWSEGEDIDADAGILRFTTAMVTAAGTKAVTCTGGTNGEDGALSWLIFADNTSPTVALNSPADASSGSDTTPTLNFTGTDADSDEVEYQAQVGLGNPFDVLVDATSNSGVIASDNQYSWNHTVASQSNRLLAVTVSSRDNDNPTNRPVTGITAGGVAMTLAKAKSSTDADGDDTRSEIWILPAPAVGTIAIEVTHTGTVDHAGASAISLYNASQSTTPHTTGEDEDTQSSATTNPSIDLTLTKANCMLIDTFYHQDGANLTVGTGQTSIAQLGTNGGGDRVGSSYKLTHLTGTDNMGWTAGTMDAFVAVAIAIEPFADTVVNAFSASDAGFTAGHPFPSGDATDYTVQSALSETTYYWRVRAIDPIGSNSYGAWATIRSFTITAGGTSVKDIISSGFIPFAR